MSDFFTSNEIKFLKSIGFEPWLTYNHATAASYDFENGDRLFLKKDNNTYRLILTDNYRHGSEETFDSFEEMIKFMET